MLQNQPGYISVTNEGPRRICSVPTWWVSIQLERRMELYPEMITLDEIYHTQKDRCFISSVFSRLYTLTHRDICIDPDAERYTQRDIHHRHMLKHSEIWPERMSKTGTNVWPGA